MTPVSDRRVLAQLAVRLAEARRTMPTGRKRRMLTNLSRRQLALLEECVLTRLTLMTQGGYRWLRDEERAWRVSE